MAEVFEFDRHVGHKRPLGSLVALVAPNLKQIYRCPEVQGVPWYKDLPYLKNFVESCEKNENISEFGGTP